MNDSHDRWSAFIAEVRRRHVVRVGLAYAGAAFVLLQVAQLLFEALLLAEHVFQWIVVLALVGFPLALLLAWIFDLTREGLRVTGPSGQGDRLVARFRPRYLLGGALVVLASVGALVFANAPRTASAEVAPGADLIAVLPFSTSGDAVRVLEQGMVDLLSRNLNEVGGIRTVDPRIVLSRWEERARGGQLSFEGALDVALDTHASSFLTGSVVAVGAAVRISADLFSIDGSRLAGVRVDGPAEDVLGLVDSLSLALLREIWRSSEPIPRLNVGAITSGDIGAIRAFLAGERFYRASAWDSALVAFGRAIAADSLFALAHYRLATTAGWAHADESGERSARLALGLVDRLPAREQTLVRAEVLRRSGRRAEAIDTLSLYLEQYPDDPEAWFLMADDLYHLRDEHSGLTDRQPDNTLWMFEQALTLDPQFTPALIHPLELAFRAGDTLMISRYLEGMERVSTADSVALRVYRSAYAAVRQPESSDRLFTALRLSLDAAASGEQNLSRQGAITTIDPLLRLAQALPAERRQELIGMLEARQERLGERNATSALFHLLVMDGRLADARDLLIDQASQRRGNRSFLRELAALPVLAGLADSTFFLAVPELAPAPEMAAAAEILAAVDQEDAAALREALRRLNRLAGGDEQLKQLLARAGAGFLRMFGGQPAEGLLEVEAVLRDAGFGPRMPAEAFWMRWLAAAGRHPETRQRALAVLEAPWPGDPLYEVPRLLALGQALESAGRSAEARDAYGRVASAWNAAGVSPAVQRRRGQAAALARLAPSR